MNLWMPDQAGRAALGPIPDGVSCRAFPRGGPVPAAMRDAEFLVPSTHTAGLVEMLGDMPALRVVQTLSAGVDWLLPSVPDGVTVCSAKGTRDGAVAEWVLAAILASRKRLAEFQTAQRERRWQWHEPDDLAGSTVLILGYGSIGQAGEQRLLAFGTDVIRVARHARKDVHCVDALPELISRADVLVVLLPLTTETHGLLGADLLRRLPAGALLVNAARGPIVERRALLELLKDGRLRAVLDVTDPEPLPANDPLWQAPNLLITPHVAGDSPMAERLAFALVGEQVRRYTRGEPLINVVTDAY